MIQNLSLVLYEGTPTSCPYLEGRTWKPVFFTAKTLREDLYEWLLSSGFRRSGYMFYQNQCHGCSACVPIRVPVSSFQPSSSMKKCLRKNRDVVIQERPLDFDPHVFSLYKRYTIFKHGKDEDSLNKERFSRFLCRSPLDTRMWVYYAADKLIGASWVDVLPHGLSSVYFAFEPEEASRSLGTFSALKEIEIARSMGKEYYYLGFYVAGSPKMSYKGRFKPHQLLIDGKWQDA